MITEALAAARFGKEAGRGVPTAPDTCGGTATGAVGTPRPTSGERPEIRMMKVWNKSGRGQPHSKTLARCPKTRNGPQGFGVRLSSAAFLRVMKLCRSALALIGLLILASGCRTSSQHAAVAAKPFEPPAPYVRASNSDSNTLELQIASRRFTPPHGKGPTVWLTGVSHIGTSNYFAQLQQHLNARTLVLFEGVGEHSQDFQSGKTHAKSSDAPETNDSTPKAGLQSSLASSLGLVFQLDSIDYDRPNFRHSDLSIREIRELLAEPRGSGGGDAASDFDNLLSMMEGDSFMNIVMQFGLGILASSPKLQAMSKVTLIEVITEMGGDPSRLGALSPELRQLLEVLIAKRNERVISDLKSALKEVGPKGSISIFYGTGHMNEMETRLRKELHYQAAEDVWFSPITVNLNEAGISPSEVEFIRGFIKTQMRQLSNP